MKNSEKKLLDATLSVDAAMAILLAVRDSYFDTKQERLADLFGADWITKKKHTIGDCLRAIYDFLASAHDALDEIAFLDEEVSEND